MSDIEFKRCASCVDATKILCESILNMTAHREIGYGEIMSRSSGNGSANRLNLGLNLNGSSQRSTAQLLGELGCELTPAEIVENINLLKAARQ